MIYEYIPRVPENISMRIQEDELEGYKFEPPEKVGQYLADYYDRFWRQYMTDRQQKR